MNDKQLDELLQQATPELDCDRQQRMRSQVDELLESTRPSQFLYQKRIATILAIACTILLTTWLAIRWQDDPVGPAAGEPIAEKVVATPNTKAEHVNPNHVGSDKANFAGSESTNMRLDDTTYREVAPVIISKIVSKSKRPKRTRSTKRQITKSDLNGFTDSVFANRVGKQGRVTAWFGNWDWEFDQWKRASFESFVNQASTKHGLDFLQRISTELVKAEDTIYQQSIRRRVPRSQRFSQQQAKHQLKILNQARMRLEQVLVHNIQLNLGQESAKKSFKVLCRVGSQNSWDRILSQWEQAELQADIAAAANRLATSQTITELVLATDKREVQTNLMSHLLCRHDEFSLDMFLDLTANHNLHRVASNSGKVAHCVPLERLLKRLTDNRRSIARAAAATLSQLDDPRIAGHLIHLAQNSNTQHAALMALTARHDASSKRFVSLAANDRRLSVSVGDAVRKWQDFE